MNTLTVKTTVRFRGKSSAHEVYEIEQSISQRDQHYAANNNHGGQSVNQADNEEKKGNSGPGMLNKRNCV
jgi:hypothetical protein